MTSSAEFLRGHRASHTLSALLARIAAKVEERSRNPWYDLHRIHFYKDKSGIKSVEELRRALEHFHVILSEPDLQQLYAAFPLAVTAPRSVLGQSGAQTTQLSRTQDAAPSTAFDFKRFADQIYPDTTYNGNKSIHEGRYIDRPTIDNGPTQIYDHTQGAYMTQQQVIASQQRAQHSLTNFDGSPPPGAEWEVEIAPRLEDIPFAQLLEPARKPRVTRPVPQQQRAAPKRTPHYMKARTKGNVQAGHLHCHEIDETVSFVPLARFHSHAQGKKNSYQGSHY